MDLVALLEDTVLCKDVAAVQCDAFWKILEGSTCLLHLDLCFQSNFNVHFVLSFQVLEGSRQSSVHAISFSQMTTPSNRV